MNLEPINADSIREEYSVLERCRYQLKKAAFFVIVLIAAAVFVNGSGVFLSSLLVKQAAKAALGILLAGVAFHFGAPKIGLQTELARGNIAVAIVVGAIILGVILA